mmetsp:Transcript_19921/g.42071  ORF Transcript_19921/g.42071 Transcript_19921/m.42071 type:complete len:115 (+) Transcript_19921:3131-3475(+)
MPELINIGRELLLLILAVVIVLGALLPVVGTLDLAIIFVPPPREVVVTFSLPFEEIQWRWERNERNIEIGFDFEVGWICCVITVLIIYCEKLRLLVSETKRDEMKRGDATLIGR